MAKTKTQTKPNNRQSSTQFVFGASKLCPLTRKRIRDLRKTIIKTHLKPYWVEHVKGGVRGRCAFEGTIRDYFWSPEFIPPILENAIIEMLDWTAERCQKANLNPELYIKETAIELQLGLVNYIYDHMVHLDQVFRSKGNRKSVKRVEVYDDKVPKMHELVEQYAAAVNLISVAPKETTTAQSERNAAPAKMKYDIFICHASEDKKDFVKPLADALIKEKLRVWYDEFELTLGDSLREKIDHGLANSEYGVVVLSEAFFRKKWPQDELDGLVARQNSEGKKVILPIWHKVSYDEVKRFSPMLAGKFAAKSEKGIKQVVDDILKVINYSGHTISTSDLVNKSVNQQYDQILHEQAEEESVSEKPADIDHIIELIEQIADTRIELQDLQSSKRYEAPDLSTPSDYPTPENHLKATLEQLQVDLSACLYPLWPEILRDNYQGNQLRREVEALINYQYDRREVDQWISRFFSPQTRYRFGTDKGLIAYKKNLIRKFRRVKKILEYKQTQKPAETGRNTTPAKRERESWLWRLYEKTLKVIVDAVLERAWPK